MKWRRGKRLGLLVCGVLAAGVIGAGVAWFVRDARRPVYVTPDASVRTALEFVGQWDEGFASPLVLNRTLEEAFRRCVSSDPVPSGRTTDIAPGEFRLDGRTYLLRTGGRVSTPDRDWEWRHEAFQTLHDYCEQCMLAAEAQAQAEIERILIRLQG